MLLGGCYAMVMALNGSCYAVAKGFLCCYAVAKVF